MEGEGERDSPSTPPPGRWSEERVEGGGVVEWSEGEGGRKQ